MLIRFLFLLFLLSCSKDHYTWFYGSVDEAIDLIKSESNKLVLLDFYSDGWGSCVRLDAETFIDDGVRSFSNSNLVSIKLKPWEDEIASSIWSKLTLRPVGRWRISLFLVVKNVNEKIKREKKNGDTKRMK